ncbi:IS1380 family transposase [Oligoflexus tunisiensis]|uniref:IS1380 family transposase n=1 Tax=Oligoflexus tunisiensis TaxID=708132 RepID=UPI00114CD0DB|nr:IS1380 family transposase [Oligoflexus tunisiensis]
MNRVIFQDRNLSSLGGLLLFKELLVGSRLDERVGEALPRQHIASCASGFDKFRALLLGFLSGAECLEDMDRLRSDPMFREVNGTLVGSTSYGDYLRKFSEFHLQRLNQELCRLAGEFHIRSGSAERLILDIDSTGHEQHGEKMEGLAYNYKKVWGLDSIEVFDQKGFLYHLNVREGNAFTADDAPFVISEVSRHLPRHATRRQPLLRADSGYCNNSVFKACEENGFGFLVAMRENLYSPLLRRRIKWRKAKGEELEKEKAEVGESLYYSKLCEKVFRVIFIRRPRTGEREIFADWHWTYQAYVTTESSSELSAEVAVELYRQRGNAENFIRELKNGFDLHHFPCQKLKANRAYGLIAAFAYNFMRFVGLVMSPTKPMFSKRIRFTLVKLACQVVRRARRTVVIFPRRYEKEVKRCFMNIRLTLGCG